MNLEKIYLDYAAATPVDKRVLDAMLPYFCERFGNANSPHAFGREGASAVDGARRMIASALNVSRSDIFFTSGGSEANNWAIKCAGRGVRRRVLVAETEHPSVLSAARERDCGFIRVNRDGVVTEDALLSALSDDVALVSVMLVNNETGVIQNIKRLAAIAHSRGALFHSDGVQAFCGLDIDLKELGVDLFTVSAHKIYGPKGIGALYAAGGADISPLISGGHQERSMRGGTTNVPAAVGFGKAVEILQAERTEESDRLRKLCGRFVGKLKSKLSGVSVNGGNADCIPGIINIRFDGISGESLAILLDMAGVACSVGAACSAGSVEPSHVLKAMGLSGGEAESSVRFSFGRFTGEEDAEIAAELIISKVDKLRKE